MGKLATMPATAAELEEELLLVVPPSCLGSKVDSKMWRVPNNRPIDATVTGRGVWGNGKDERAGCTIVERRDALAAGRVMSTCCNVNDMPVMDGRAEKDDVAVVLPTDRPCWLAA